MTNSNIYSENDFLDNIEIYLFDKDWNKSYKVLQEYLKYYSTKRSTIYEYLITLIFSLKDRGYKYNAERYYLYFMFNINGAILNISLFNYTIGINTSKLDKDFKITVYLYKLIKSILEFSYIHQLILPVYKESQVTINPLVNRLGYVMNPTSTEPNIYEFVRVEKKTYSIVDIYE